MHVVIRTLTDSDLARATELIRLSFADVAERFCLTRENCPGNGAFLEEEKLRADHARGVRMFGLFRPGAPEVMAGFVALKPRGAADGPAAVWYVEKLAVSPQFRRQGAGSALLGHAVAYAKTAQAETISIGVIRDHLPLVRWYEQRGFRRTREKRFASLPFTVLYMELALRPGAQGLKQPEQPPGHGL